ncbi:hypothetical protein HDU79_006529 [Rhizoclosmatium sp. JEL0117]|nr:hypothetical protein HDU79_006529 [Rhizoclosmatium sp. JEL0117]
MNQLRPAIQRTFLRRQLSTGMEEGPRKALLNVLEAPAGSTLIGSVGGSTATIGGVVHRGPVFIVDGRVFLWDVPQYGIGLDANVGGGGGGSGSASKGAAPTSSDLVDNGVFEGWSSNVLGLLEVVRPTPEILVVGTGAQMQRMPQHLRSYLNGLGMQVEIMSTRHAASTYNLLVQEGRRVAAALLPVIPTSARTGLPLVTVQSGKKPNEL